MEPKDRSGSGNPLVIVEDTESGIKVIQAPGVPEPTEKSNAPGPWKRWMGTLRRTKRPRREPQRYVEGWPDDDNTLLQFYTASEQWENLSGYSSHLGKVKSTSLSTGSQSAMRSRGNTQSTANPRSSSEVQRSTETSSLKPAISSPAIDEEAQKRALKRRHAIQEILSTETDYVHGLNALTGVLSIFQTRPDIYHNVLRIREIHDHLLTQLHNVTPTRASVVNPEFSTLFAGGFSKRSSFTGLKNLQNRSLRTRRFKENYNLRLKTLVADPAEARDVAQAIENLSMCFDAYEKYCSTFDLLRHDMTIMSESIPNWGDFDKGIEALSKSVGPMERRVPEEKKSMSLNDLLIKPIQRVCRYHLLLQELLKHTPSSDCPASYEEIKQASETFKALASQVDSATGNPDLIRKTELLQRRLKLPELSALRDVYTQLGRMSLCGVLHVTYQSQKQIIGAYMVCVLFDHYLLIARSSDEPRKLKTVACLYVWDAKIDTLRNGKGLCCYGCLFSWKLVFSHRGEQYELVLSASTSAEEKQWTSGIIKSAQRTESVPWEPRKYSILTINLQPLESSGGLRRQPSVQSLSTSRATNNLPHVIIRKTNNPGATAHQVEGEIERPKFTAPQGAVRIATRREDRIRLEQYISELYTSEALPFPGMVLGPRPNKMKKLTTFGRRSISVSPAKGRSPRRAAAASRQIYRGRSLDVNEEEQQNLEPFPCYDEKELVLLEGSMKWIDVPRIRNVSKETTASGTRSSIGSKSWRVGFYRRVIESLSQNVLIRMKTKKSRGGANSRSSSGTVV